MSRNPSLAGRLHDVTGGEQALASHSARGAFSGRRMVVVPESVLLDFKLPTVDGLEVLLNLKSDERNRSIPAIVLASSMGERDVVESGRLGVNRDIVEPVQSADLSAKQGPGGDSGSSSIGSPGRVE